MNKETFEEWISKQERVKWPEDNPSSLLVYLHYKEVPCAGMITKINGKVAEVKIMPLKLSDKIGSVAGESVIKSFDF
jgi:hypothetical protein